MHAHETPRPETVVSIRTADGQTFQEAVNVAIPMRDLDAQWAKLEAKFLTLTVPILGEERANQTVGMLHDLERLDDVSALTDLLTC